MSGGGSLVEDQRAFQLALELSMLSLGEPMPAGPLGSPLGFAPQQDDRAKKSQNMTECVPVPSSEHVAEIVGRQGSCVLLCYLLGGVMSIVLCHVERAKTIKSNPVSLAAWISCKGYSESDVASRRSGRVCLSATPYVRAHVPV